MEKVKFCVLYYESVKCSVCRILFAQKENNKEKKESTHREKQTQIIYPLRSMYPKYKRILYLTQ